VGRETVERAFREAYAAEPFVRLTPEPPELRAVVGTNFADVHVTCGDGVACVMVVSDNLGKGMAGTAVQNMNLMLGLPETTGLRFAGAGL
jgi:N-acetyl-gamma-glutamylphosphate reductase